MKVITYVLSFICVCAARNIKWSPEPIADIAAADRESIKEQFRELLSQLANNLSERDEHNVKEFLHLVWEMYRLNSSGDNEHVVSSHRPHPFLHDGEEMMKPFPHEDIPRPGGDARETADKEIVRPFPQKHTMRPLHVQHHEAENVEEQETMRPFPYKPNRPHHSAPLEVDREMENSQPQMNIMRPLHSRPMEHDKESVRPFIQKPAMRPLEATSDEVTHHEIMTKPLPYRPQRPQNSAPVENDEEIENSLPEKDVMWPLIFAPGKLELEEPFSADIIDKFRPSHTLNVVGNEQ